MSHECQHGTDCVGGEEPDGLLPRQGRSLPPTKRGTCEECRYFSRLDTQCRKSPPTVVMMQTPGGVQMAQAWPPVRGGDWCGEFRSSNES